MTEEVIQELSRDEQHRRDQQLLHEQLLEQNRDRREAHMKSRNSREKKIDRLESF